MVYVICVLIGIVTAFVGSLVGLGGGVILVPTMLFLYQYTELFSWATPQTIVGISLIAMVFTALSSTIYYSRNGRVDYKTGLLFLTGSIPGGFIGSWLNQYVSTDDFSLYFGFLMIVLSLLFLIRRKTAMKGITETNKSFQTFHIDGKTYYYTVAIWQAFSLSLVVGMLSGLFGIGGGSVIVPAMILLFGIPAHIATATSMFMIFFVSMVSAGTHIALGHIAWEYALFFIPGAYIGGTIGAKANQLFQGKTLERILRILLIVIGIRLIMEGLI
ncbi:sulfite exporter TauE/SafE family protein [Virgibacillus byunsanensis]|uniref:Probable membrane transporter protein n=1 Tax=Virgibacillus byunsanensis TaxID=570945 RepID=A0ABW3LMP8_9BACI